MKKQALVFSGPDVLMMDSTATRVDALHASSALST